MLDYNLFTKLLRTIVSRNFSPSSFKLKRGILLTWKNIYFNLKTAYHINAKLFLWTKLLENLLLYSLLNIFRCDFKKSDTNNIVFGTLKYFT